jgi:hypothetical protein
MEQRTRAHPIRLVSNDDLRRSRLRVLFRIVLAIPAMTFSLVLLVVLAALSFASWFVCLILGRLPKGMSELGAYCLRFEVQTLAYVLLLTDRYPSLAGSAGATSDR